MQANSQTIFRPELMDERWLGEELPRWMQEWISFSTWMIVALFASLIWFIFGLSIGAAWWVVLLLMLLGPIASIATDIYMGRGLSIASFVATHACAHRPCGWRIHRPNPARWHTLARVSALHGLVQRNRIGVALELVGVVW